jgi:hypothetical protein
VLQWRPFVSQVSGKVCSSLSRVFGVICLAWLSCQLPAQEPAHAPDGGTMEWVQNISIPPLRNAPFTAAVSATLSRTLGDGSTVAQGNQRRKIARDSSGRIFQERHWFVPLNSGQESKATQMEFSDPATHELFLCHPAQHLCRLVNYFAPASISLHAPGPFDNGKRYLTREDLGKNTVEGVDVIGTRETTTINQGVIGNDHPLTITKEFWYSPTLGINILVKRSDPRYGTQIFAVSDISFSEPDPQTFVHPADYKVIDQRQVGQRGQIMVPPPPPLPAK